MAEARRDTGRGTTSTQPGWRRPRPAVADAYAPRRRRRGLSRCPPARRGSSVRGRRRAGAIGPRPPHLRPRLVSPAIALPDRRSPLPTRGVADCLRIRDAVAAGAQSASRERGDEQQRQRSDDLHGDLPRLSRHPCCDTALLPSARSVVGDRSVSSRANKKWTSAASPNDVASRRPSGERADRDRSVSFLAQKNGYRNPFRTYLSR